MAATLTNLKQDLIRSKKTPLLIEVTRNDILSFSSATTQSHNDILSLGTHAPQSHYDSLPSGLASLVYNPDKQNNILVIDADRNPSENPFFILDCLIDQLRDEVKDIKNIKLLKESLKTFAAFGTGGVLGDFVGEHLDKGLDFVFDELGDGLTQFVSDILIESTGAVDLAASSIEGIIHDLTSDTLGDTLGKIQAQTLTLSSDAKNEIDHLSQTFSKAGSIEVFQLTFRLLLATGIANPKLLLVNNPHKLDHDSIAIISLLFSLAKQLKEKDKSIGISAMFTYTDEQYNPYQNMAESEDKTRQLLTTLRHFTQRYAMLEKPSSDIPTIAVKSTLFVGRNQESTQLDEGFKNRKAKQFSVVAGEPGVGKTSLINQHLLTIQQDSNAIVLSVINEAGYSSGATGLSALEQSIIEQEKKLVLRKTWKDKGRDLVNNLLSKQGLYKAAGILSSGADKILHTAESGFERAKIDADLNSLKSSGKDEFNNLSSANKSSYFTKLNNAIDALIAIATPETPIVLFIDDLQWIDNQSSEYILTQLITRNDIYIVSSLRPSDAAAQLKRWQKSPSLHQYAITLLSLAQIKDAELTEAPVDTSSIACSRLDLAGFDQSTLRELIERVIQCEADQSSLLTQSIIKHLSEGQDDTVNTLFCVETINLICDEKLYRENEVSRLILDHPLRINSELEDVENAIEATFSWLQNKYKQSLAHINTSQTSQRFNLMSYAVFEERLNLLKIHFGTHGNAAVNTLLFSTLLGAPFNTTVVNSVIDAISKSSSPQLEPLREYLVSSHSARHLSEEHYLILEEVYEILRRLNQATSGIFNYRHTILQIFLNNQMDYLLTSYLDTDESIHQFFNQVVLVLYQKHADMRPQATESFHLSQQQVDQLFYIESWIINTLTRAVTYGTPDAEQQLVDSLQLLVGTSLKRTSRSFNFDQAYSGIEQVVRQYLNEGKPIGLDLATRLKFIEADYYCQSEMLPQAKQVCLDICSLYENLPEKVQGIYDPFNRDVGESLLNTYVKSLKLLSSIYSQLNEPELSTQYRSAVLKHSQQLDDRKPADKIQKLIYQSRFVLDSRQDYAQALNLLLQALELSEQLFRDDPAQYAFVKASVLNALAGYFENRNQADECLEYVNKAFSIIDDYGVSDSDVWTDIYFKLLIKLLRCNQQLNNFEISDNYLDKAIKRAKGNYQENNRKWATLYSEIILLSLPFYDHTRQHERSACLIDSGLEICQQNYSHKPDAWYYRYQAFLQEKAQRHFRSEQYSVAAFAFKESLTLIQDYFAEESQSEQKAQQSETALISIGRCLKHGKNHQEAVENDLYLLSMLIENIDRARGNLDLYSTYLHDYITVYYSDVEPTEAVIRLIKQFVLLLDKLYNACIPLEPKFDQVFSLLMKVTRESGLNPEISTILEQRLEQYLQRLESDDCLPYQNQVSALLMVTEYCFKLGKNEQAIKQATILHHKITANTSSNDATSEENALTISFSLAQILYYYHAQSLAAEVFVSVEPILDKRLATNAEKYQSLARWRKLILRAWDLRPMVDEQGERYSIAQYADKVDQFKAGYQQDNDNYASKYAQALLGLAFAYEESDQDKDAEAIATLQELETLASAHYLPENSWNLVYEQCLYNISRITARQGPYPAIEYHEKYFNCFSTSQLPRIDRCHAFVASLTRYIYLTNCLSESASQEQQDYAFKQLEKLKQYLGEHYCQFPKFMWKGNDSYTGMIDFYHSDNEYFKQLAITFAKHILYG